MLSRNTVLLCAIGTALASCGVNPIQPSEKHIQRPAETTEQQTGIPQPLKDSVVLPPPKPATRTETYSVVVTNVPVQEILFALARDAKINLDIHPGIGGTVTVNAVNQTLPQILTRIARQVDMRYELDNGTLTVMPDSPYLRNYRIDYVNISRDSDGSVSNTTQVGGAGTGGGGSSSSTGSNDSKLTIKNASKNHFWETLVQNIKDILRETDKIIPEGSSEMAIEQRVASPRSGSEPQATIQESDGRSTSRRATFREAASVIANPENGIITVRATGKQHEKIQEFIDQVMVNAQRQVLIEATIVEVRLSDQYQQGIDWSALRLGGTGFQMSQGTVPSSIVPNVGRLVLDYANPTSKFGNIASSISLLESFGNVKVLSSPKLSVMNNQTAMLRVVDNLAYFTVEVTPGTPATATSAGTAPTFTTTLLTSPVGFTMSVTPQINDSDSVLLNVRPSITRLIRYVDDPNPSLANPCGFGVAACSIPGITSKIPETSTREMESMLKIENNQIAVLGGLMEDRMDKTSDEVPLLASIPWLGELFKQRNDTTSKTELVIFLRPVVIKNASLGGDFSDFRSSLPNDEFFNETAAGKP